MRKLILMRYEPEMFIQMKEDMDKIINIFVNSKVKKL